MNCVTRDSGYTSASSRAHPPHIGAAVTSSNAGWWASRALSTSSDHWISMRLSSFVTSGSVHFLSRRSFMRRLVALGLLAVTSTLFAQTPQHDIAGARAVFEDNLAAIRERNRDKYLACYLHSELLVRGGPTGVSTGFDEFAKGAGGQWPDLLEANDIHLTQLQPGVGYR